MSTEAAKIPNTVIIFFSYHNFIKKAVIKACLVLLPKNKTSTFFFFL